MPELKPIAQADTRLRIIEDSNEQIPFVFSEDVLVIRRRLVVGDYSLDGFEHRVVIERKELGDLLGSLGGGRTNFDKEMRQLRAFDFAAIVVEANWPAVLGLPDPVLRDVYLEGIGAAALSLGVEIQSQDASGFWGRSAAKSRASAGYNRSKIDSNSVLGSLMSFTIKYGVLCFPAHDHRIGGILTERLLYLYAEQIRKDHKALQKAEKP